MCYSVDLGEFRDSSGDVLIALHWPRFSFIWFLEWCVVWQPSLLENSFILSLNKHKVFWACWRCELQRWEILSLLSAKWYKHVWLLQWFYRFEFFSSGTRHKCSSSDHASAHGRPISKDISPLRDKKWGKIRSRCFMPPSLTIKLSPSKA